MRECYIDLLMKTTPRRHLHCDLHDGRAPLFSEILSVRFTNEVGGGECREDERRGLE